jgi:hypothetical protein
MPSSSPAALNMRFLVEDFDALGAFVGLVAVLGYPSSPKKAQLRRRGWYAETVPHQGAVTPPHRRSALARRPNLGYCAGDPLASPGTAPRTEALRRAAVWATATAARPLKSWTARLHCRAEIVRSLRAGPVP